MEPKHMFFIKAEEIEWNQSRLFSQTKAEEGGMQPKQTFQSHKMRLNHKIRVEPKQTFLTK